MYPRLTIDLTKLKRNLDYLTEAARARGVSLAIVTKCLCADKPLVRLIGESGADYIADSRVQNLKKMEGCLKPRMLLRVGMPSEAEAIAANSEISLQSEIKTIRALGAAAAGLRRRHKVVLMIDMGDLREGVFFRDKEKILETAEAAAHEPWLELYGVGVNLTCYGAVLPDCDNLGGLVQIADMLRSRLSLPIPLVSGGNSSSLTMLLSGDMPDGINNLRLGESFLLGNDTAACAPLDGLYTDAFLLEAELVERQIKPSKPIGSSGANAFGEPVSFADRGPRARGILAIGRQDTDQGGLRPVDPRVETLGASSDHLLVDLTACPEYGVGSIIRFVPDYGALLRAATSCYVEKIYYKGEIKCL